MASQNHEKAKSTNYTHTEVATSVNITRKLGKLQSNYFMEATEIYLRSKVGRVHSILKGGVGKFTGSGVQV
jgi:hypothetical protein